MIGIDVRIEDARRFGRRDRFGDQSHSFGSTTFTEVWDALYETWWHDSILDMIYKILQDKSCIFLLVPPDRFINQRKSAWQRLEELLKLLDSSSLRRLDRNEVRELGRIYRRTASDLAIARAESRDPRLVSYLNSLVIRAHGRIYRADAQGGKRIRRFFTHELPQTFRRTWRYTLLSFSVFATFAFLSFVATRYDPEFSELVGVPPAFRDGGLLDALGTAARARCTSRSASRRARSCRLTI